MAIGEVRLRRGEERELLAGGCWVYDNEVSWVDEDCTDGGIVDVTASDGSFVGRGFFNGESKIVVRLVSREREEIDGTFIARRIRDAWLRRRQLGFDNACRVVFGDADGLPGLTVDKFGEYLSFQRVMSRSKICALVFEVAWSRITAPSWVRRTSFSTASSGFG